MGRTQSEIMEEREEKVDGLIAEMKGQGYSLNDLSVDGDKANKAALLIGAVVSAVIVLLFGLLCGWSKFGDVDYPLVLFAAMLSVLVHEGIHGLFFGIFAKNHFKSIEFGIIWKSVNPYCYCGEPLSRLHYMTGLLMPAFILGFCTAAAGLIAGNASLIIFSVISIFLAGGDLYIAGLIVKTTQKGREELYLDHPNKPGVMMLAK
jgi:hypothetical protein